jgi:hypothetical protein
MASVLLGGLFAFGGFAVTGTDISAVRIRRALTHPLTTGMFLWSVYSTLVSLGFRHPLAGAAVLGGGVFFALVILLIFHQRIIWATLGWYCASACVLFCVNYRQLKQAACKRS